MSWNIKIEGNYFYATNTVNDIVHDYPAKKVRIAKKYDDSDYFVFQYNGIDISGMSKVPFVDIVAENGTDFTDLASFELWKNENTGSSGSGSGSGGSGEWGSITGEIYDQTDLISIVSGITVNGNLSINEFNSKLQLNNNSTEYYGCNTILNAGRYTQFEFDYTNGLVSTGNGILYVIILDQNDVTIAYERLQISSFPTTDGVITISFDTDVVIPESGIYQTVIGRRNWNGSTRRVELFQKDVNSSNGAVWVAYSSSNPSLNVGDSSTVDWSTINKQNFNRIPKAIIYKS